MVVARLLMFDTQCHYIQTNVFNWIPTITGNQFGLVYYTWVLIFLSIFSLPLNTCDHLVLCCGVTGSGVGVKCEIARVVIHSHSCTCGVHMLSWSYSLMYTNIVCIHAHATCVHTTNVC